MAGEDAPLIPIKSAGGVSPALQNTQAFLDMITGKSSTTTSGGETKTSQTDVSSEGISELIRQIMEGTGGLADVATGSHVAGLYNDSTKTLLVQNLMAKVAGQAALASAKTTTTTTPQTNTTKTNPQLTGSNAAAGLLVTAATSVGGKLAKKFGLDKVLGLDDSAAVSAPASAGAGITNIQNITDTSPAGLANDTASDLGTMGGSFGEQVTNVATPALVGTDDSAAFAPTGGDVGSESSFINDDSLGDGGAGAFISGAGFDEGMDLAGSVASAGSDLGNALDWLPFSKGGRVPKAGMPLKGYASGGLVNEDRGTPAPIVRATPLDESNLAIRTTSSPQIIPASGTAKKGTTGTTGDAGNGEGGGGNPSANTLQTADAPFSLSQFGQIALGVLGMMSNPVFGIANFATQMGTGKGIMSNAVDKAANLLGFDTNSGSSPVEAVGGGMTGGISAGGGNSGGQLSVDPTTPVNDPVSVAAGEVASADVGPPGGGISDSGGVSSGAGSSGTSMSADTDTSSGSFEVASAGVGADVGAGTGESDSETSGGAPDGGGMGGGDSSGSEPGSEPGSFADGGQITAPGDGSQDTRIIKAADDEFVLNAQAARAIGYDKLTWLNTVLGGFQGKGN